MRYLNNPANIRYSEKNKWYGLEGQDNGFCVFKSYEYGVRALVLILKRYVRIYKMESVKEIFSRFAPSCENDTRRYVAYVESVLVKHGYDPDHIVYLSPAFVWLCIAICWYESHTSFSFDEFLSICRKLHLSI